MKIACLYICLFFGSVSAVLGQDRDYISATFTPGFLLAHRADLLGLAAHNYGIEMAFEQECASRWWSSSYKKPSVGYGALYYNLGSESTGHALGFTTNVKLNLARINSTDIKFRMCGGLAYLSKKFDLQSNRRNQAIGSHFNGSMQFGVVAHSPIKRLNSYLEYGISISHYSNAAFKVPNLGYNIPSITIRYGLGVNKTATPHSSIKYQDSSKFAYKVNAIYGKKQLNFGDPINFRNYGLQLRILRTAGATKAWRLGADVTLDKTYKYSENHFYPLDSIRLGDKLETGLAGGFQWGFGRVAIIAELGAYIYKPAILKNPLNQRLGLNYEINRHWNAQGTLKFHRGVADFFEMGIGYTL